MEKIKKWLSDSGSDYDNGYKINQVGGKTVYDVDGVKTVITHIKDSVAKGFILNRDFSLTPCFVVKGNGYFAHGETLKEAIEALHTKIFENMDSDEAIKKFIENFEKGKKYKGTEFFEWHHYLTGSCLMGRESFVKNRGLNLEDMFTVDEFIEICENDYGSGVIRELKERWQEV